MPIFTHSSYNIRITKKLDCSLILHFYMHLLLLLLLLLCICFWIMNNKTHTTYLVHPAALGNFVGIKPFYVSFVLAPLASNASELVASMNYASKKTKSTITTSLSTLLGAANMNNTFCLAIFYALIVCRTGLKWTFSAETIVIVGVQVIMFFFAYQSTMKLWTAWVVLSFFPLSILLVAWLESASIGML